MHVLESPETIEAIARLICQRRSDITPEVARQIIQHSQSSGDSIDNLLKLKHPLSPALAPEQTNDSPPFVSASANESAQVPHNYIHFGGDMNREQFQEAMKQLDKNGNDWQAAKQYAMDHCPIRYAAAQPVRHSLFEGVQPPARLSLDECRDVVRYAGGSRVVRYDNPGEYSSGFVEGDRLAGATSIERSRAENSKNDRISKKLWKQGYSCDWVYEVRSREIEDNVSEDRAIELVGQTHKNARESGSGVR